jgi:hypothetical protein
MMRRAALGGPPLHVPGTTLPPPHVMKAGQNIIILRPALVIPAGGVDEGQAACISRRPAFVKGSTGPIKFPPPHDNGHRQIADAP